jgi:hypothetical protein
MIKTLTLIAALSFALSGSAMADTYKLDAKGKCHADNGKFAKQELCASAVAHTYKTDSKGKCRDEKGKFAASNLCHA